MKESHQDIERKAVRTGPYADIIDLPHPVSKKHPPMPLHDRAAQFAPFAALTGYEAAIDEATEKGAADICDQ